ncbi:hypothetical protein LSTR_LSTR008464 [Laodelphax striatellus]|uniref:Uncharacterized protein n=1 Tax=Laodelphax striatellus TaxID=195883 RepID=A0A482XVH0_LAOST|nr:hypothetical protein LSTR_LSTR008464 [Laodelphax striatellus]
MKNNEYPFSGALDSTLQPVLLNSSMNVNTTNNSSSAQQFGKTWSNSGSLNIDIDNLALGPGRGGHKHGSAPSMNQLASNPTSPMHPAVRPSGFPGPSIPASSVGSQGMQIPQSLQMQPNFFPAFK